MYILYHFYLHINLFALALSILIKIQTSFQIVDALFGIIIWIPDKIVWILDDYYHLNSKLLVKIVLSGFQIPHCIFYSDVLTVCYLTQFQNANTSNSPWYKQRRICQENSRITIEHLQIATRARHLRFIWRRGGRCGWRWKQPSQEWREEKMWHLIGQFWQEKFATQTKTENKKS